MLELLFVIGFFVMLLVTGISLLGIIAALVVATVLMFVGGLFALIPGYLKAYRGFNEIVITMLLNYVGLLFVSLLPGGPVLGRT